jgi:hypothetical protein
VKTVRDPVFEVLAAIISEVLFHAVYETFALFSIKFSKVRLTTLGIGVGFTVGAGVGLAEEEALALGAGLATGINTPLFHTNFLPLLTHVYVLPALALLIPALLHVLPAFTAAYEFEATSTIGITRATKRRCFLMPRG